MFPKLCLDGKEHQETLAFFKNEANKATIDSKARDLFNINEQEAEAWSKNLITSLDEDLHSFVTSEFDKSFVSQTMVYCLGMRYFLEDRLSDSFKMFWEVACAGDESAKFMVAHYHKKHADIAQAAVNDEMRVDYYSFAADYGAIDAQMLFPGRKYVSDFSLNFNGALIPDAVLPNGLTIHQNLEIIQRFYYKEYGASTRNIIVANIGFVIGVQESPASTSKHFVSIPINDPTLLIVAATTGDRHSEDALRDYLEKAENINKIILKLSKIPGIKKIYCVVVDIHSTREMCGYCDKNIYALQNQKDPFLENLYSALAAHGIRREDDNKLELQVLVRISGFEAAGLYNKENRYRHIICEQYDRNAATHASGVMLHLVPKNGSDKLYSQVYSKSKNTSVHGQERLRRLYGTIKAYYLKSTETLELLMQTGFKSNFSKKELNVERGILVKKLFLFNVLSTMSLYQIWYDWSVLKPMILKLFPVGKKPSNKPIRDTIRDYLYPKLNEDTPNTQSNLAFNEKTGVYLPLSLSTIAVMDAAHSAAANVTEKPSKKVSQLAIK